MSAGQSRPVATEGSGQNECSICSFLNKSNSSVPIYHRHFSSLYHRQITGAEDSAVPYLCPSCMRLHKPYPDQRLRVVVSDSTLHQFFAPPGYTQPLQYQGDSLHVDYLTIDEADIETLSDAFKLEYLDFPPSPIPMDVVMVAGYEDLVARRSNDYIIAKFQEFAHMIIGEGHRKAPHSVAVASLMYPPKLAWMRDDGALPNDHYVNQRYKIDCLNSEIARMNQANGATNPPKIHTYGIRTSTMPFVNQFGRTTLVRTKSHRWDHWIGQDRAEMLYLCPKQVFKIGTAINNYFRFNT